MHVLASHKKHLRGFSLAELAIILGVVGVILAGIWALGGSMHNNGKQEKFSEMLTIIVANIRGNYTGKSSFESTQVSVIMPILTNLNVFPNDAVHLSGAISIVDSPFGEVATLPAGLTTYNSLYVCGWKASSSTHCDYGAGTAGVPLFAVEVLFSDATSCADAVLRNSSPATLPGLVAVYINGTQMTSLPPSLSTIAPTAPAGNCTAAGTKTVDFVYRLNP